MKQTAIEWLIDYLKNIKELPFIRQDLNINEQNILNDIIEQVKEMEKEQIIDAWQNGIYNCGEFNNPAIISGKQYYNETFKSEE